MKENIYLKLSTLIRIRCAIRILGEIMPGYGLQKEEIRTIASILHSSEEKLSEEIEGLIDG